MTSQMLMISSQTLYDDVVWSYSISKSKVIDWVNSTIIKEKKQCKTYNYNILLLNALK